MRRVVATIACLLFLSTPAIAEKEVVIPLGSTTNINASINWKGKWTNSTDYLEGEVVQYLGSN